MAFCVWEFVALAVCSTEVTCGYRYSYTAGGAINFSISDCIFKSLAQSSSSVNGGAICIIVSSAYALAICYSSYANCSSGNYGGAVYFSGGCIIVNHTCALNCAAVSNGQFIYSYASTHTSIGSISCSKCAIGALSSSSAYSLLLFGGVGDILRINSSDNFVSLFGGAILLSSSNSEILLFANIVNCSATGSIVDFYIVTQLVSLSYSNIINCTSGSGNGIVICSYPTSVSYCIFKGNTNSYVFRCYNCTMSVSICWIDHSGTVVTGSVFTAGCSSITTCTFDLGKCGCATMSDGFTFYQTGSYTTQYLILLMILLLQ